MVSMGIQVNGLLIGANCIHKFLITFVVSHISLPDIVLSPQTGDLDYDQLHI